MTITGLRIDRTCTLLLMLLSGIAAFAQTTIINPNNNTGTSGADGSFQNATSSFAANGWSVVNGSTNRWFVGTQSSCAGTKGAYISNNGTGNNNNYTNNTSDISHFYKDVTFPAGQGCITLSFSWRGQGESVYDGLRIYLGSNSVTPVAGTRFTTSDASAVQLGNAWYNLQGTCTTATITIPSSYAGTTRRLVFSWENDNSVGTNPAATVDAVSLVAQAETAPSCATGLTPANLATNVTVCGSLSWTAPASSGCNTATSYDVYFGTSATPPYVGNTTSTSYTVQMNFNTTYYWQIRPKNTAGTNSSCSVQSFTTGSPTNPEFNLTDNATSASPYNCVTLTQDLNTQRGCAWDANSTLNFLSDFSYEIDVYLGDDDAGADGMAFVVQNDPLGRCKCGSPGGSMGAGGITNSVTVEIDTYINFEDRDDFVSPTIGCAGTEEPDHLDIWFNGVINPDLDFNCNAVAAGERVATPNAVRLQSSPGVNYNIENGLTHKFRITWTAATQTLTASVLNSAMTVTYGTISSTFNPITIFGTNTPYFGFTGSTGGLSNQQSFCLPNVLLPVSLSSFDVTCDGGKSLLSWKTESERDNTYFTLERSCNGSDFTVMGTFAGHGTTSEPHAYTTDDPVQCGGVNYYRLSQTDNNGATTILGVRSVAACDRAHEVLVYPNPATDELTLAWEGHAVTAAILYNAFGQPVVRREIPQSGETQVTMDVSSLASGIYYMVVYQQFGTKTIKVTLE